MMRFHHFYVVCAIALTSILLDTSLSSAGIVFDSNGVVTSFTTDNTTYYFYKGSYNEITETTPIDAYGAVQAEADSTQLMFALREADDPNINPYYIFLARNDFDDNDGYAAFYFEGQWSRTRRNFNVLSTSAGGGRLYYYASTTAPSSVPEPSTAILMGLLGIVGFAGNRRRRRQVSAA